MVTAFKLKSFDPFTARHPVSHIHAWYSDQRNKFSTIPIVSLPLNKSHLSLSTLPPTMNIIIISACNGIGLPILVLSTALIKLEKQFRTGFNINIIETHIFEISTDASKICTDILNAIKFPGVTYFQGDMNNYPQFVGNLMNKIKQPGYQDVIFIVLSGTPCQAISRAARKPYRTRFGIHAAPSNIWWKFYEGYTMMLKAVKHHRILNFCENVQPACNDDTSTLDQTAGFRSTMTTTSR